MNINLREIEYILTIAEEGSVTKAAQKLYIAQPSLSQVMKKIEVELGVRLFTRIKNRIKLTDAGKSFVESGKRIVSIGQDLESRISSLVSLHSGSLSLGTPYHLGAYVVPELLATYRKEYPDIEVNLHEGTSEELEVMILDGLIDAAIMPLPLKHANICYHPFLRSRMILVMSKSDPLNAYAYCHDGSKYPMFFDLRNASSAPFLIGQRGQRIRKVTEIVFRQAMIDPRIVLRSQNVETIRRIAAAGYGLAIMPEHYLKSFDQTIPASYYYLPPEQDYEWTIVYAFYHREKLSLPAQRLMDIVTTSPRRNGIIENDDYS